MSYTIKVNAPLTVQQVHDLYQQTHFDKPIDDAARLQVMIDETQLVLSVWDDEHLIGFARCLTDTKHVVSVWQINAFIETYCAVSRAQ